MSVFLLHQISNLLGRQVAPLSRGEVNQGEGTDCDACQFGHAQSDRFAHSPNLAVSALRKINTDMVIDTILNFLPYGPQYYDEDTVTDQPMRQIVAEVVREKALHALQDEIPHGIAVTVEKMRDREDGSMVDIDATIVCERESHKGIIIGKQGAMLKKIGSNARYEIEHMLEQKVNLKLWVKVRRDWRDSDIQMKNFGYNKKDI